MGSKVTLFDSSEDHKDLTKKKFLSKVTFTFEMNRMYARKCLENKLHDPTDGWLPRSYKVVLKTPPATWKTKGNWFIIAWLNGAPIGIMDSTLIRWKTFTNNKFSIQNHNNIYVKPQYRNFGLGTELLELAMKNHPDDKFNFIMNGDPALLSIGKKYPDRINIRGWSMRWVDGISENGSVKTEMHFSVDFGGDEIHQVVDFGADPTGNTDSSESFKKAIDCANSLNNQEK